MNRINTRLNIIARVIAMMVIVLSPAVLSAQCGGGSASWCTPSIVAGPTPYNMGISNVTFGSINNTTNRFRISSDTRYQLKGEPVDERWIGRKPKGHYAWMRGQTVTMEEARAKWEV